MSEENTNRWGRYVLRKLAKHGLSYRSQRIRTGQPHSTVLGWVNCIPPRHANALAFIRGLGEDEEEGLREAGFGDEGQSGAEVLMAGIAALAQELGRPIRISFDERTKSQLNPAEAEEMLALFREQAAEGLL